MGIFGDNRFMLLSLEVECPGVEESSPVDGMAFKARGAVGEWCDVEEQSEEKTGVSQQEGDRLATDISVCPWVSSCWGGCRSVGDREVDSFSNDEVHH